MLHEPDPATGHCHRCGMNLTDSARWALPCREPQPPVIDIEPSIEVDPGEVGIAASIEVKFP